MSSFVLDASMALGWILDKPIPPRANQVRQRLRQTVALVPSLWHYEVTNVLVMARRTRHITEAELASLLEDIEAWKNFVSVEPVVRPRQLAEIAQGTGLTVYEAAYIEVALRHRLPLATLDKELEVAARKAGVNLL